MLFNSVNFALFLPIVFSLYWFATKRNLRLQNLLLLFSSYFFYACWDWRFMFLLIFSTILDFFTGIKVYESSSKREKIFWLYLSIGINLGFLGFFKYYNFFAESFAEGLILLGFKVNFGYLNLVLPVGISFYTFHGLSYVLDLYNEKIKPERNFIDYSVFVSFFPLLVAGPIERATHLLPQIKENRSFDYSKAVDGLRQILWGLFKKIVIADGCAEFSNTIFNNYSDYSGSTLLMGALFFTFQIYCDFSGYSDIALGTARLFGIELLRNFAYPYFSRDIAEFWRRWHISLSTWFKDYLYIPMGGSKIGMIKQIRNTFIIFIVSGFWHGANWTFIVWGALNAIYLIPSIVSNSNRRNLEIVAKGKFFPSVKDVFAICYTFSLTVLAWIFFRSETVGQAINYIFRMLNKSIFSIPEFSNIGKSIVTVILIIVFMIIEWMGREQKYAIFKFGSNWKRPYRIAFYYLLLLIIFYSSLNVNTQTFIYFQF
jgi:alginate O-acetyltransferase complex protein AlgI